MKEENRINLTISKNLKKEIDKHVKDFKYSNAPEFIREAIREKLFGKSTETETINKFLSQIEEEKDYYFKENKDIYKRLKTIAKNF